jgi:magnesium transporter
LLTAYTLHQGQLTILEREPGGALPDEAVWVELAAPEPAEMALAKAAIHLPLPETRDVDEIEASSHYAVYQDGLEVNCLFFHQLDDGPSNTNVSFVLTERRLVTLCSREVPHTRLLRMRSQRGRTRLHTPLSILFALLEIKIESLADEMEQSYKELESISRLVLGRQGNNLEQAVDGLAEQEDLVGKVRLCLMDGQRDLKFLQRQAGLTKSYRKRAGELLGDIESLFPHNDFLSDKADFLLNAAQGFINIEQNRIMKSFSIAALVFLPPTLIAGIYGMNFHHLPGLDTPWGFWLAVLGMLAAAISPYLYFRLRRWL